MVAPILIGAGLLASGWLFGKSGGGGGLDLFRGVEIGTKKEQEINIDARQDTYAPVITRTYDVAYNIASEGSAITTKKEQEISQTPTISPSMTIVPTQLQGAGEVGGLGGGAGAGAGMNIYDMVIIGGIGLGVYLFFFADDKKK